MLLGFGIKPPEKFSIYCEFMLKMGKDANKNVIPVKSSVLTKPDFTIIILIIMRDLIKRRPVIIFWAAILISATLSLLVSFQADYIGGWHILGIISFFGSALGIMVEMLKWPLGKQKIDDTGKLSQHLFGDIRDSILGWPSLFHRESIISAIKGREAWIVWKSFLSLLFMLGYSLIILFVK
jgi:hypothetical protein